MGDVKSRAKYKEEYLNVLKKQKPLTEITENMSESDLKQYKSLYDGYVSDLNTNSLNIQNDFNSVNTELEKIQTSIDSYNKQLVFAEGDDIEKIQIILDGFEKDRDRIQDQLNNLGGQLDANKEHINNTNKEIDKIKIYLPDPSKCSLVCSVIKVPASLRYSWSLTFTDEFNNKYYSEKHVLEDMPDKAVAELESKKHIKRNKQLSEDVSFKQLRDNKTNYKLVNDYKVKQNSVEPTINYNQESSATAKSGVLFVAVYTDENNENRSGEGSETKRAALSNLATKYKCDADNKLLSDDEKFKKLYEDELARLEKEEPEVQEGEEEYETKLDKIKKGSYFYYKYIDENGVEYQSSTTGSTAKELKNALEELATGNSKHSNHVQLAEDPLFKEKYDEEIERLNQQAIDEENAKKQNESEKTESETKTEEITSTTTEVTNPKIIIEKDTLEFTTVCWTAGVVPGTRYSKLFIKYLNSLETTDWAKEVNGKLQIDKTKLKAHKTTWINSRKNKDNDEDVKEEESNETKQTKTEVQKAKEKVKETEKQLEEAKKRVKDANTRLEDTEKGVYDEAAVNEAKNYFKRCKDEESRLLTLVLTLRQELKLKEDAEKKAKENSELKLKATRFYVKKLKKFIKDNSDFKDLKSLSTEDFIKLAAFMIKKSKHPYKYYDDDLKKQELDNLCKDTLNVRTTILSIENELDPATQKLIAKVTPNTSGAFLQGVACNTFEVAKLGKSLYSGDLLKKHHELVKNVTTAAASKLTIALTNKLTSALIDIADVSMFTKIPVDAAQEMVSQIMTPADAIKKLTEIKLEADFNKEAQEVVDKYVGKVEEYVGNTVKKINLYCGDELKDFNKAMEIVVKNMNQDGKWYVMTVDKYERMAENKLLTYIDTGVNIVSDYKFQAADFLTETLAANLVIPVNNLIMYVQMNILTNVLKLKELAIAQAKILASKAILKILGLMGG